MLALILLCLIGLKIDMGTAYWVILSICIVFRFVRLFIMLIED